MTAFDAADLFRFAEELRRSPEIVKAEVRPVMSKAALNVKDDWNDSFRASRSFKGVAGSVTYDTKTTRDGIEVEVGPDKERHPKGALANIAIFGGSRGGGTVADPQEHLDAEEPRLIKAMGDVIREAIR